VKTTNNDIMCVFFGKCDKSFRTTIDVMEGWFGCCFNKMDGFYVFTLDA
jgi:hypothetical protein